MGEGGHGGAGTQKRNEGAARKGGGSGARGAGGALSLAIEAAAATAGLGGRAASGPGSGSPGRSRACGTGVRSPLRGATQGDDVTSPAGRDGTGDTVSPGKLVRPGAQSCPGGCPGSHPACMSPHPRPGREAGAQPRPRGLREWFRRGAGGALLAPRESSRQRGDCLQPRSQTLARGQPCQRPC